MKGHAKVVILMFSLHYFFLEIMIIKYFHLYWVKLGWWKYKSRTSTIITDIT